jgi:O-acetyl-ADP-ribose deacetylase (regulator of RNase III)
MSAHITYLKADPTKPATAGNKIIVHICNDIGGWGKGFVMAVSKRWPEPEKQYREWYRSKEKPIISSTLQQVFVYDF